jgi:hypothetical protein
MPWASDFVENCLHPFGNQLRDEFFILAISDLTFHLALNGRKKKIFVGGFHGNIWIVDFASLPAGITCG